MTHFLPVLPQLAELLIPQPLGTHQGHPYRLIVCDLDWWNTRTFDLPPTPNPQSPIPNPQSPIPNSS
jgi:hypothetical protein